MKDWGVIARVVALLLGPLVLALYVVRGPSDGILCGIAAAAFTLVMTWVVKDAHSLPKWMRFWGLIPSMLLGTAILASAGDRYEPFPQPAVGVALAAIVAAGFLACAITSRRRHDPAPNRSEKPFGDRVNILVRAGLTGAFAGLFFLLPILILLNGQSEARPPFVATGRIKDMKRIYVQQQRGGRGGYSYVLVLDGLAADYASTVRKGEFMVSEQEYRAAKIGDRRCVTVHTGLLRIDWFVFEPC